MAPKEDPIALQLLSRAHSPDSTTRIHTEKVLQRPLHLKPTEPVPNTQQARRLARLQKLSSRKKKLKPKPLSARQKRSLCLYDIPQEAQKYEIYVPLHKMWVGYIQEVLWDGKGMRGSMGIDGAAKLCSADFHGAEVEVVRSRCVGRVGLTGIVVKDSKFTFEIITPKDQVKTVPKEHTVFRFKIPPPEVEQRVDETKERNGLDSLPATAHEGETSISPTTPAPRPLIFELHGDQFIFRAADRANRKFKPHFLKDL